MRRVVFIALIICVQFWTYGEEEVKFAINSTAGYYCFLNMNLGVEIPIAERRTFTPFINFIPYDLQTKNGVMIMGGIDFREYLKNWREGFYYGAGLGVLHMTGGEFVRATRRNRTVDSYNIAMLTLQGGLKTRISDRVSISNGIIAGGSWIIENDRSSDTIFWYMIEALKVSIEF